MKNQKFIQKSNSLDDIAYNNVKDYVYDRRGGTKLHYARNVNEVRTIIDEYKSEHNKDIDINAKSITGNTPLHVIDDLDSYHLLVDKYGADIDIKNNKGENPKDYHYIHGYMTITKYYDDIGSFKRANIDNDDDNDDLEDYNDVNDDSDDEEEDDN